MISVSNLDLKVLMRLDGGHVLDHQDQPIAHYKGDQLLNLQNQVLGTARPGEFFNAQGQRLATVSDAGEILSTTGSVVGYVEGYASMDRALAVGAWMLYFAN